jgi:anti-sigma B factor antagonist
MPHGRHSFEVISGMPVVTAPAEIDLITVDQLRRVLLDAAAHGHTTVVLDMTRTRFCDSAGLRALVQTHRRALTEGGELRLVIPVDGIVFRVFNLTGLYSFIPRFGSLEAALAERPAAAIPPSRPTPAPGPGRTPPT